MRGSEMPISPLFMFGFERSGTTLLSMMIGAHPSIAVPLSVTGRWLLFADQLGNYHGLETRDGLKAFVDSVIKDERIRLWDVSISHEEILQDLPLGSYPSVIRRFHEVYAAKKGKPYWANLDISTLDNMDLVNQWFPDAKFIHIFRDGRDVALSHGTMPYGVSNIAECAERWVHRLTVNLKMGAILGDRRYMAVRYEDLVLDSARTLQEICHFIGIPYADEMLGYYKMVEDKVPKEKRWLWPELDKPPAREKAYAWERSMSKTKRDVFEGVAGDLLRELGYKAYDTVPKSVSRYAYELWCFIGRGGRVKRLTRKLGIRRVSKLERNADR